MQKVAAVIAHLRMLGTFDAVGQPSLFGRLQTEHFRYHLIFCPILQHVKNFPIQQFIAQLAIETLHITILPQTARINK